MSASPSSRQQQRLPAVVNAAAPVPLPPPRSTSRITRRGCLIGVGMLIMGNAMLDNITNKPSITIDDLQVPPQLATCALLFFGLLRAPEICLPSIQENLLEVNHKCDVYVHTYNVTSFSSPRSNEINMTVNPHLVYQIVTDDRPRQLKQVIMDTDEEFHAARNVSFYRRFFPPVGWHYPSSMDNMIKQWHGIQRVWDALQAAQLQRREANQPPYERVGLFRLDTYYPDPISIRRGHAVIPYFANRIQDASTQTYSYMNDRMFYGTYDNAEVWASTRFDSVLEYLRDPSTENYLHSETYLAWIMRNVTNIQLKPLCLKRVRANGETLNDDCMTQDEMLEKATQYKTLQEQEQELQKRKRNRRKKKKKKS